MARLIDRSEEVVAQSGDKGEPRSELRRVNCVTADDVLIYVRAGTANSGDLREARARRRKACDQVDEGCKATALAQLVSEL